MFFLALSCLQGRPMRDAADALLALEPDGLQLTPGNQPDPALEAELIARGTRTRTHHGFSFSVWKQTVWRDDGSCAVTSDSVHAPLVSSPAASRYRSRPRVPVLETMYPGYALGCGAELEAAMNEKRTLAVDVSHVFLQQHAGVIAASTWKRLQDYEHIAEVHVSRNNGRTDAHQPLTADTFGLAWALAKLKAGTPVILESYFHRVSNDARREQCRLFERVRS